jgi:hypothetical protein
MHFPLAMVRKIGTSHEFAGLGAQIASVVGLGAVRSSCEVLLEVAHTRRLAADKLGTSASKLPASRHTAHAEMFFVGGGRRAADEADVSR